MTQKLFYTYVDFTTEDEPRPYYVGKGTLTRVKQRDRNPKWKRISAEYGWDRQIVLEHPDERICLKFEKMLIKVHKTFVLDDLDETEIGCNKSIGGQRGPTGYRHTSAAKQKMRNNNLGKKFSPEINAKKARKGEDNGMFGKKHKESSIELMRAATLRQVAEGRSNTPESLAKTKIKNSGESSKRTKLSWNIVNEIRSAHQAGVSQLELAKQFSVTPANISSIVLFRSWNFDERTQTTVGVYTPKQRKRKSN